ncbi:MAG: hypothetical protein IPG16_01345 [Comamonadaceae bacterium]|nr:hypothetical protein [Comamonadaceae bacterium]
MSGIAGIIHFDGRIVEPGEIERVTEAMRTRGPDAINHWRNGNVALGHCMLRTTPESLGETQPLISDDGQLILVFDGRLDNREELSHELQLQRIEQRTSTDAELVLGAYRLWGENSPKHLLGDFVYAVWDERQQKLFCARDHMGARPFYYVRNPHVFAFASEDEALLGLPGVSNQPNEERIAHLLVPAFRDFDTRIGWCRDILSLMPAQSLVITGAGVPRVTTYWRLEPGEESVFDSDAECQQAFIAIFSEAVRCRMRSAGPVAAMMSGGLDSAGIAAIVKRLLPEMPDKEFHTYSAVSDDPESCLESQCIRSLTKSQGANAHFVSVPSFKGMASIGDLIDIAWSRSHPVDNSILLPMMMCQVAGRQQRRVVLNGVSGDVTMHVPNRYPAFLMRAGNWREAWRECQAASRNNTYVRGSLPQSLFLLNAGSVYLPKQLKLYARRIRGYRSPLSRSIINPGFAQKLRLAERLLDTAALETSDADLRNTHAAVISSTFTGIVVGLAGYEHMAGRFGVELRDPWADKRVVEFFLRLPLRYKTRNGWTKYLVRTSFGADLEDQVRFRKGKEHLGWHFAEQVMRASEAFIANTITHKIEVLQEFVDKKSIRELHQTWRDSPDWDSADHLHGLLTISGWLDRILR